MPLVDPWNRKIKLPAAKALLRRHGCGQPYPGGSVSVLQGVELPMARRQAIPIFTEEPPLIAEYPPDGVPFPRSAISPQPSRFLGEVAAGFEPANRSFADSRLRPLGYATEMGSPM